MHQSSLENMEKAVRLLKMDSDNKINILDVGGRGLNSDRSYFSILSPYASEYHVADLIDGENVTHVMTSDYVLPMEDQYYHLIVSGQTLEHVKNPFKLVKEMTRVLKDKCYMILIAPSTGPRHDSIDCWRFMDDSFKAIAEEVGLETIADWIDYESSDKKSIPWRDHIFIGKKL